MFKILKIGFLSIVSISIVGAVYIWLADCKACMQEQDYIFMEKIKAVLHKEGDVVKVTDIHPGNWVEVCVNPGGYNSNLASNRTPQNPDALSNIILNDADPYISEWYSESAVIFRYEPSENGQKRLEIYQMTHDLAGYSSVHYCLGKDDAYFLLKHNSQGEIWKKVHKKEHIKFIKSKTDADIWLISKQE